MKWYSPDKGYGFIAGDEGRTFFVRISTVAKAGLLELHGGHRLRFAVEAPRLFGQRPRVVKLSALLAAA